MRKYMAILAGAVILAVVNFTIFQREQLITHGRVVLLDLAPLDPRSLMQGDYMALRFKLANEIQARTNQTQSHQEKERLYKPSLQDGRVVVTLDAQGVGSFSRIDDGTAVAANQAVLRYRVRNDQVKLATNAFFFQEGHGRDYEQARYGEFRVAANGDMLLSAMRGADLKVLEPSRDPVAP